MLRFLRSIIAPSSNQDEIRVSISELSPIWLKYNQGFTQQEFEPENRGIPEIEITSPEPVEKRFFSQEVLSEFFEPYRSLFQSQGAVDGFLAILELLDRHGSAPSVVTTMIDKDSEADEIYSVRQTLEKVTLREHSSNGARIMIKLIKETYRDYENLIPMRSMSCAPLPIALKISLAFLSSPMSFSFLCPSIHTSRSFLLNLTILPSL
jgi:hypothetical protein